MTTPIRMAAFGFRGLDDVEGGIETHARELYPRLAALGLDVQVLVRSRYAGPGSTTARRGDDVAVVPLWAPTGKGIETAVHAAICTAYCLVRRPDVVHIHGIGPGAFAGLLRIVGTRVVVTHHGQDYDATKWGPLARLALRVSERMSVRGASAIIAVSRNIADSLRLRFDAGAVVIGNGMPAWSAAPPAPDEPAEVPAASPYVLMVGRITKHKRVLDVVEAFRRLPDADVRLVLCGEASDEDPDAVAVERAAAADPRIVVTGHVEHDQLARVYRGAACLVMASSYEGLPLVVLEAIRAGCPVLVSDIPAHVELDLAPFQYFAVGDLDDLTDRLARLLRLPVKDATSVQAMRVDDPRFDWDHIARATAAVLTTPTTTTRRVARRHRPGLRATDLKGTRT
ncbi:glycosyltransferase [Nocardioides mangrovi]|uniref:Glycosyltransferase n=1 Tax=Nocardioides mangrovi TaxID=2874580 RepID=A0ABS7U7T3_9ACTN|nr:glycosyltransferase [Nocardioides mangrovi]MBZ5736895.1 glycosyltransferase [Nocardioides mangrovi]